MTNPPNRFSQIYLQRGQPTEDSVRFRRRLATRFEQLVPAGQRHGLGEQIQAETGADVPKSSGYYRPQQLLLVGEMRDVLDAVSVVFRHFETRRRQELRALGGNALYLSPSHLQSADPNLWRDFVASAAAEENVSFRPDEKCVMHFHPDEAFARDKASTVALLSNPAMSNAGSTLERAYQHLDGSNRHEAVWLVFMTAETLAKEICPQCQQLNSRMLVDHLLPACRPLLGGDTTEESVWSKMFESYGTWITGMHNYRHGQPGAAPLGVSVELAVHIFTTGTALIRTLAVCLQRKLASGTP